MHTPDGVVSSLHFTEMTMTIDEYHQTWDRVSPIMRALLVQVVEGLEANGLNQMIDEPMQAGDDEYRLQTILGRGDTFVCELRFTLHDGANHGSDGYGISLSRTGPESVLMGGWYPGNYTPEGFVQDPEVILGRLESFPVDEFVLGTLRSLEGAAKCHPELFEPA